jgi:hypothetical protein
LTISLAHGADQLDRCSQPLAADSAHVAALCVHAHTHTHAHPVVAVGRDSKRWRLSRHARVAQAHDPTVAAINHRAAAVLRLPLANQEPLDVLRSETSAATATATAAAAAAAAAGGGSRCHCAAPHHGPQGVERPGGRPGGRACLPAAACHWAGPGRRRRRRSDSCPLDSLTDSSRAQPVLLGPYDGGAGMTWAASTTHTATTSTPTCTQSRRTSWPCWTRMVPTADACRVSSGCPAHPRQL